MESKFKSGDIVDLYCVDCKGWTRQKYRRVLADGAWLFLCQDCGCENTIEKYEQEQE